MKIIHTQTKMMIEQLISSINVIGRAKNMKEDNFYSMQRFEHQKHKGKQAYTID
jgi:hypothetical protein